MLLLVAAITSILWQFNWFSLNPFSEGYGKWNATTLNLSLIKGKSCLSSALLMTLHPDETKVSDSVIVSCLQWRGTNQNPEVLRCRWCLGKENRCPVLPSEIPHKGTWTPILDTSASKSAVAQLYHLGWAIEAVVLCSCFVLFWALSASNKSDYKSLWDMLVEKQGTNQILP